MQAALSRFRTHPRQMWLTLAGLAVGTAATILVITLGLSGRGFVLSEIEGVGSHLLWASYSGTVTAGVSRQLDDSIRDDDIPAVAARSDLFSGVTPLTQLRGRVDVQSRAKALTVLGTTANYPIVRKNLKILRGRFLDPDDLAQRAKVCVVNRHLYEELFANDDSRDKFIQTFGTTFAVIGEFEEPVDTLGQGDVTPETIFIPITVAWYFTPAHRINTLFVEVRSLSRVPQAEKVLREILLRRHHAGSQFDVESMAAVLKVANAISIGLLVVFTLVAAISVVVGGVGIMNILLASVEQRTREIGLRMSLGARPRDVLAQFLAEAAVLGILGSGVGLLVGTAIPLLARVFFAPGMVHFSPVWAILAFLFSLGIAIVFGITPAYRAAQLDPAEALRHE